MNPLATIEELVALYDDKQKHESGKSKVIATKDELNKNRVGCGRYAER